MPERQLSKRNIGRDLSMMRDWENPFQSMQQTINRLFGEFLQEPFGAFGEWETRFTPSVDIDEDEQSVRLYVELPGMDEKDVTVTARENTIIIEGEKKREHEEQNPNYYRRESSGGSFYRAVSLPAEVDQEKAQARFDRGVLYISLPKTERARKKERKIEITSG
jgi:HSP20 family protein